MINETAKQKQLEQWVTMIQECESRPKDMSVAEWCKQHGITKALYYYRKREVTKAGLLPEKSKWKPKQKTKEKVVETTSEKKPAEVLLESPEAITESVAKENTEPAMKENVAVETIEPAIEETPEIETAKEAPVVEITEKPFTKHPTTATSSSTLDITIGSATIHVNEETSTELLCNTIRSIISAIQTK